MTRRTPGFTSWQQELWQTCCDDACEFHGDATKANLKALKGKSLEEILEQMDCDKEEWTEFLKIYEPGSSPAVYHFTVTMPKYAVDFLIERRWKILWSFPWTARRWTHFAVPK